MRIVANGFPTFREFLFAPLVGLRRWLIAFEIQATWRGIAIGTYAQRDGRPYLEEGSGDVAREWSWRPWFGRWRDGRPWWWV